MSERFMIVSNNDCTDYVIPVDRFADFEKWLNEEADDGGSEPDWAQPIDSTCGFTFTDPEF